MRTPLDNLHTPIVESSDPDAKYCPSGENTTLQTDEVCPLKTLIHSPFDTLLTPIVLSADPSGATYTSLGLLTSDASD